MSLRALLRNSPVVAPPRSSQPLRSLITTAPSNASAPKLQAPIQFGYTRHTEPPGPVVAESAKDSQSQDMSQGENASILGLTLASHSQSQVGAEPSSSATSSSQAKPPKEKKGRKSKHAQRKQHEAEIRAQEVSAKNKRLERSVPSEASGGVPEPSPQYMLSSFPPPSTLSCPRRILIVMDLNGTLLHRPQRNRPFHFVERPHAQRFLQYCLDSFHVAIWSSARPQNVNKMVSRLLTPDQVQRCLLVWARDQFGLSDDDYNMRVQCYKRLQRVWGDPRVIEAHPDAANGGRWDQTNTVLVDDSSEKGRSEPYNILALPEFTGLANEKAEVLPQVHDFLNTLAWQADVSRYMRENPFKLDPNYSLPSH